MAKKSEPVKPIFPLKHEFVASLDRFIHEAGMLADSCRQAIQLGVVKDGAGKDLLVQRLAAFDEARFGDEDTRSR